MKPSYKASFPIVLSVLLQFCSCTANTPDTNSFPEDLSIRITASIDKEQEVITRVTETASASAFEDGDMTGIYVVNHHRLSEAVFIPGTLEVHGNQADNEKHSIRMNGNASAWTAENPETMQWTDAATPIDLFAYSPYSEKISEGASEMTTVPFNIYLDQSADNGLPGTAKRSNYQLSDLMWAEARNKTKTNAVGQSSDPLELKFTHLLSKISVKVTLNDEFPSKPTNYLLQISGTYTQSNVDFTTGKVSVVPSADFSSITPANETPETGATYDYRHKAILIPQKVAKGTNLLVFAIGTGKDCKIFQYKIETDNFKFEAKTHYRFDVIVGRYNITVQPSIIGWEDGGTTTGTPENTATICGILMKEKNLTEGAQQTWSWTDASENKLLIGYHLPTSDEINKILPASTLVGFDKNGLIDTDYFCDATNKVIYGIKTDKDGVRYWMRWEYKEDASGNVKLKISHWKSDGPTDIASIISTETDQAKMFRLVRNAYPTIKPETMYFPAIGGGADTGKGIYWVKDGDAAKSFSFDNTKITMPVPITVNGSELYAVRYIQNTI